jgi:hypothetical protein
MKFEIKHRYNGSILFECEATSIKIAVELAIEKKADLSGADLSGADLSWAKLSCAKLSWANLSWANLSKADLSKADLSKADLSCAKLSWAKLSGANLSKADLSEADLSWADLSWAKLSCAKLSCAKLSCAKLSWANLSWANLSKADLSKANEDFFKVLTVAKLEVVGLYKALVDGKVDGSTYTGECACLVGTVANIRGENHATLGIDLRPDSNRPSERWFLAIKKGDTPDNNQVSKITKEWIEEFAKTNEIKLPEKIITWKEEK